VGKTTKTLNASTFDCLKVGDRLQWILPPDFDDSGYYRTTMSHIDVVVTKVTGFHTTQVFSYKCRLPDCTVLQSQIWYVASPPLNAWGWLLDELIWFDIWGEV